MDALHLKEVRTVAAEKGCISFISGKFNVIHPGHLRLFRFAKEISDYLVVGIYPDGEKGDFLLSEEDRLDGICSNQWVDAVFVLRESVANAVSKLKPDIVVKRSKLLTERDVELAEGGRKQKGVVRPQVHVQQRVYLVEDSYRAFKRRRLGTL